MKKSENSFLSSSFLSSSNILRSLSDQFRQDTESVERKKGHFEEKQQQQTQKKKKIKLRRAKKRPIEVI